jgi:SNW domain-containing protein 1
VKGYTIPLDKRLSADGRNLQDVAVNDKFAALSEDLYLSERKAREEIKIRNDMIRQKRVREEEVREQQLRDLAMQARTQRADLASKGIGQGEDAKEAEARQQRMDVLKERQREIERDQRLELAGKKNKKGRDEDRDVSERIALGQVSQPTSHEAQYDARLFNQSSGLDSGYHGGADDKCDIYDKALFADRSQSGIYRHDKDRIDQTEGRLAHISGSSSKTHAFAGAADPDDNEPSGGPRTRPVEFEQDDASSVRPSRGRPRSRSRRRGRDDADDFGLDGLLEESKRK